MSKERMERLPEAQDMLLLALPYSNSNQHILQKLSP